MDDLEQLEIIALVSKLTSEISNYTGVTDKTLAQFVLDIHDKSKNYEEFKKQLKGMGAEFPDSFIKKIDTLIMKLHPKYQNVKIEQEEEEDIQKRKEMESVFKGLSLPDGNRFDSNIYGDDDEETNSFENRNRKTSSRRHNRDNYDDKQHRKGHRPISPDDGYRNRHRSRSPYNSHRSSRDSRYERDRNRDDRNRNRERRDHRYSRDRRSPSPDTYSKDFDDEPIIGNIYSGKVTGITHFGIFVRLKEVRSKVDGLVHISKIKKDFRISDPSDVVEMGQNVKVKVIKIGDDNKISLSMNDVDQITGDDIAISHPALNGSNAIPLGSKEESSIKYTQKRQRANSMDKWEFQQLVASGVVKEDPKLREDVNEAFNDQFENLEQELDIEIEVREEEPPFLAGQTAQSLEITPERVVKAPDGSLNRAAMNGAILAKERREERQQKAKEDAAKAKEVAKLERKFGDDPLAYSNGRSSNESNISRPLKSRKDVHESYGIHSNLSIKEQRESLPVFQFRKLLINAIRENPILVVVGETGSGKSTQLTQYLAEEGFAKNGRIGCTQPRRVAAMSVSKRVAEEVGCRIGDEVGFTIRFEDVTSNRTKIKYLTDGMLQREILLDPDLNQYSVILLDEAHERTIATDVLFALLKKTIKRRPEFRVIVTSATLASEKFSNYFNNCPIIEISGRSFKVDVNYTREPEPDYLDTALITVIQIHLNEGPGDILVFLTGQEEIETSCEILSERMKALGPGVPELIILPVYSALPSEMQTRIFDPAPSGSRKVVLATNIAETSLTIDGIYYVVDPGFVKVSAYNHALGMDSLIITPISKAQAEQRKGRAGRTGPGKCYRLYTRSAFENEMLDAPVPEIKRQNLSNTILLLKAMGINDILNFDFMDKPAMNNLLTAFGELYSLSALDDEGYLTRLGRKMADFPMDPTLAKVLISSVQYGCSEEVLTIVAMLSVQTIFFRPKDQQEIADRKKAKFHDPTGDHLTYLNVYNSWLQNERSITYCQKNFIQHSSLKRASEVRSQLVDIMRRYHHKIVSCGNDSDIILKTFCSGYFKHASKKDPQEGFKTLTESTPVFMHPSSALFGKSAEYVIYHTLVFTSKEYMHCVSSIDPKWLVETAPTFYKVADETKLSKKKRQEKIMPLFDKFAADQNSWRLSNYRRGAKGGSSTFG